jgi:hypothetical protein
MSMIGGRRVHAGNLKVFVVLKMPFVVLLWKDHRSANNRYNFATGRILALHKHYEPSRNQLGHLIIACVIGGRLLDTLLFAR